MRRYADFRLDASSVRMLAHGGIAVTGQLTHTGIFEYRNPDGSVRKEYRPDAEVFSKAALATFASAPVTLNHPRGPAGTRKVTPETWKTDAVGHVAESVRQDGDHAVAELFIQDAETIKGIQSGAIKGISCGYDVDYDATPGQTPDGKRYDGVQRNIRGNHVALLPTNVAPRGGNSCTLRLDAAGDELLPPKLTTDGADDMTLEQALAENAALKSALASARTDAADVSNVKSALDKATAENAALKTQIAEKDVALKVASDPLRLDAAVAERAAVVEVAKANKIEPKGSTRDIKLAIVTSRCPAIRTDASDDALNAAYAVLATVPHPSLAGVQGAVVAVVDDKARADATATPGSKVNAAYDKNRQESLNAWKSKGDAVPVRGMVGV